MRIITSFLHSTESPSPRSCLHLHSQHIFGQIVRGRKRLSRSFKCIFLKICICWFRSHYSSQMTSYATRTIWLSETSFEAMSSEELCMANLSLLNAHRISMVLPLKDPWLPSPITAASLHMHITNTANRNTISTHHSQSKLFFRAVIEQKLWSWLVFRSRWGCGWGSSKPVLEGKRAKELKKHLSLNQHLPELWSWKCHTPKLLWFSLCTILNCETVKKLRLSGLVVSPPSPVDLDVAPNLQAKYLSQKYVCSQW